jgi:hypothetical protein
LFQLSSVGPDAAVTTFVQSANLNGTTRGVSSSRESCKGNCPLFQPVPERNLGLADSPVPTRRLHALVAHGPRDPPLGVSGLICNLFIPSHASKQGRRYRYYVSRSVIKGRTKDSTGPVRLPAEEIEKLALSQLSDLLQSPSRVVDLLQPYSLGMTEAQHVAKVPM